MWLFTKTAAVSVVTDTGHGSRNHLLVRARSRGDIEEFMPHAKVIETPLPADYRFRARVTRAAFTSALVKAGNEINYPNFKAAVRSYSRGHAYVRVRITWQNAAADAGEDFAGDDAARAAARQQKGGNA